MLWTQRFPLLWSAGRLLPAVRLLIGLATLILLAVPTGAQRIQESAAKSLPPTMIVHGDADKTVSVEEARTLEKLLQQHQRSYEMKIYAGQDHLFKSNRFGPDVRDAQDRTLAFFAKHLKPRPVARGP